MDRLDERQLNRATLARQLLLRRAQLPALTAIGHLAGLQAQAPLAPYVGLWTRLSRFGHQDLKTLLAERSVVRAHLMRNTIHLLTQDAKSIRDGNGVSVDIRIESWPVMTKEEVAATLMARIASRAENRS